jgi:hypothetical protein
MINPWVVVVALIVWAASLAGAVNYGDTTGYNRAEAARAGQQDAATAALNKALADAREDAKAEALKRGEAIAFADTAKVSLTKALQELRNEKTKPAASCITPTWRMRVNSAVGAANTALQADSGGLPVKLPASAGAERGLGAVGGGDAGGSR